MGTARELARRFSGGPRSGPTAARGCQAGRRTVARQVVPVAVRLVLESFDADHAGRDIPTQRSQGRRVVALALVDRDDTPENPPRSRLGRHN